MPDTFTLRAIVWVYISVLSVPFVSAVEVASSESLEERAMKWLDDATVTTPPPSLKLDPFYNKFVVALELPIVASDRVSDAALLEVGYLTHMMLGNRPDLAHAMQRGGTRLAVMAVSECTTDIPEFADLKPKNYWDRRVRGLGANPHIPVMTIGEENLLECDGDPYHLESIFVHEFAHTLHDLGLVNVDPEFNQRLSAAFQHAKDRKWWLGKYSMVDEHEYWAEGVQSYFGTNREFDHDHNSVNTRHELAEYDPPLFALIDAVFRHSDWQYTKPKRRLHLAHLTKLNQSGQAKFAWPERLAEESRKLEAIKKQKLLEAGDVVIPAAAQAIIPTN